MTDIATQTDWERARRAISPEEGPALPGHLARAMAFVIDFVLIVAMVFILDFAVGLVLLVLAGLDVIPVQVQSPWWKQPAPEVYQWPVIVGLRLLGNVLAVAFMPWFWIHGGATPGMAFGGMRVERADGRAVDLRTAILRMIALPFALISVIGAWWTFVDDRRRGWHDIVAGTVVVAE